MAGGWRRLHNEKLHNLYASPNVIRVNKSWRMRWEGHIAHMTKMKNAYKIWLETLKVKTIKFTWEDNNIITGLTDVGWESVG